MAGTPSGGETPREAGAHILQYYAQHGAVPIQLQRIKRHLFQYYQRGGDIALLERKVFTENLGPRQLMMFIEQSDAGKPVVRGPAAPAAKVTCPYCGTPQDPSGGKCSSCGAPLA